MVGQDHSVYLNGIDVVAVVAKHSGHFDLANFGQLLQRETAGPTPVFVPEPISTSEKIELLTQNASESGADHRTGQWFLGNSGRPQIDIFGRIVVLHVAVNGFVTHDAEKFVEIVNAFETTEFSPSIVCGYTMFAASLDVQRGQIQAPFFVRFLEQVIGYFLSDGVV